MAIIKPMIRSNMCINAHPVGCAKECENQIAWMKAKKAERGIKSVKEGGNGPKQLDMVLQAAFLLLLNMALIQSVFLSKRLQLKLRVVLLAGITMKHLIVLQRKKGFILQHLVQMLLLTKLVL